jgi:HSP20 family protein
MSKEMDVSRPGRPARLWDWFDRPDFGRWFEGVRPWFNDSENLRIEQQMTDDALVIRAEMPGIDPDKDVEITVADGLLTIRAEQRSESTEENEGRTRSEFRYGSFERTLRVPRDVNVDEITASYKDGILEVRVPSSVSSQDDVRQIPVKRS